MLWPQEHLDRLALVHRAIAVGGLVEWQFEAATTDAERASAAS
jgi:hypothetical protein